MAQPYSPFALAPMPLPTAEELLASYMPAPTAPPAPTGAPTPLGFAPPSTTLTGDAVTRESQLPTWQALLAQQPSRTMSPEQFDRGVASMYAAPGYRPAGGMSMGPQSIQEERDLADEQRQMNALFEGSGLGSLRRSGEAFSAGRPVEGVGQIGAAALNAGMLGGSGRMMLGGFGALGGSAALDALGVGRAEAQTPDQIATQRATIADIRKRLSEAETEQAQLDAKAAKITAGLSSVATEAARKAAQTTLGVTADGAIGEGTKAAARAELARIATRRQQLADQVARLGPDIERQEGMLGGMLHDSTATQAEANLPWWQRAARDYLPVASFGLGAGASSALRRRAQLAAERASQATANDANALIVPGSPDIGARVTGVNEFWRLGGADEPFRVAPGTRMGFEAAPQQPSAASLFTQPPGRETIGGSDIARAGLSTAGAGVGEWRRQIAQERLDKAQEAYRKERSQANADEVAKAQLQVVLATNAISAGLGGVGGAVVAPFFMRNRFARPNVQAAGSEMMSLNRLLGERPLSVRRTTPGQAGGGHWVAPGDPATAGEIWASPTGRDLAVRQPDGRFRYFQRAPMNADSAPTRGGKLGPDPRSGRRDWRRLSQAGDDSTAVG
jgi:hypothetical protein